MADKYILIGQSAVAIDDTLAWAEWFGQADRTVARTIIGDWIVSTVFLGLDHNFTWHGDPVLFETMIFIREADPRQGETMDAHQTRSKAVRNSVPENLKDLVDYQRRWHDWAEAERGHAEVCRMVEATTGVTRDRLDGQQPQG